MLKPYQGNEPYIFISYAHKDDAVVLKVIEALQSNGLRVWYDNGIKVGTEWPKFIAGRIKSCKRFIAFMSSNYEASKNCRREFNFADKYDVKTLVVFLEDFEVKDEGMDMQISLNQCMFRSKFALDSEFVGELSNAEILQCCKGNEITGDISPESADKSKTESVSRPVYVENIMGKDGGIGYVYTGYTLDGKRHGNGKIKWADGETYEGEWLNGNRHGQGKHIYVSGGVYEGQWADDKMDGKGKAIYAGGRVYDGEWKNGKRHGYGKVIGTNGETYEGEWADDKRNGRGKAVYADGAVYDGEWKNGKRHGKGRSVYSNGSVYEGDWLNGKRHGQGKFRWPDGTAYEGNWTDDKINGHGKGVFTNGDIYIGEWVDNKRYGLGTYTHADGRVEAGYWRDGKMIKN